MLTLDVPGIQLAPQREDSVRFAESAFVLELAFPGWLDESYAQYDADVEIIVQPGSLVHDRLATAIREDTTLFGDDDRNQEVSEEEREGRNEAGGR